MADLPRLRSLTAAGVQLAPAVRRVARAKSPKQTGTVAEIDPAELWDFYATMPGPNWFVRFVSNQMAQVRFFAAQIDPVSDDPVALGSETDAGETVYSPDEQTAIEVVALIRSRAGDKSTLIQPMIEHILVDGRSMMLGITREEVVEIDDNDGAAPGKLRLVTDDLPVEVDPGGDLDEVLWFEVQSTDAARVAGGRVEKADTIGGQWKPLAPSCRAFMVWSRHPRHDSLVESPFRAAHRTLQRLRKLQNLQDAAMDSRLLGRGIFLVPASVDPKIPDWLESYAPSGGTFWDALLAAMATAIDDRDLTTAVAPIAVKVPGDVIEQFRHIEFPLAMEDFFDRLEDRFRQDLAEAWNVPTSQLSEGGVGDLNHWSQWAEMDTTARTTWRPLAQLVASAWTEHILQPALRDAGVADWHRYVVHFDLEPLTERPARTDDAMRLWEAGLIEDDEAVEASGFNPTRRPDPDETNLRVLRALATSAPALSWVYFAQRGEDDIAAMLREAAEAGTATGLVRPPEADGVDEAPLGDAPADPTPNTDPTADPMVAAGDTVLIAGGHRWDPVMAEALRWALHYERDRIGRRLRSLAKGQIADALDGVLPVDVAHILGRGLIERQLGLTHGQLLQPGAFDDLRVTAARNGHDQFAVVAAAEKALLDTLYASWPELRARLSPT